MTETDGFVKSHIAGFFVAANVPTLRREYRYAVINACTGAEIALVQSPDAQQGEHEPEPSGIDEVYKLIAQRREAFLSVESLTS